MRRHISMLRLYTKGGENLSDRLQQCVPLGAKKQAGQSDTLIEECIPGVRKLEPARQARAFGCKKIDKRRGAL